jgi:hypothetical protein
MLAGCGGGADEEATDKGGETLDIESITAGSTSEASEIINIIVKAASGYCKFVNDVTPDSIK